MTAARSRRWLAAEFEAARILGSERVLRQFYKSTPDVEPVRLRSGRLLQPEAKYRKRLPSWLRKALEQARAYAPGAIPIVVLIDPFGEALGLLPLRALARELGLNVDGRQLPLAPRGPTT